MVKYTLQSVKLGAVKLLDGIDGDVVWCDSSMLTGSVRYGSGTVSIEELHHLKLRPMRHNCVTVPQSTDCNVCLTIQHTTRSIICQREASA